MPPANDGERRKLLVRLGLAAALLLAAAAFVLRGFDLRGELEHGFDALRRWGPVPYFAAMAILPAAGVPLLTFSLTAAHAFSDRMGMGGVVAAGLAAITANIALAYVLARWVLRPWIVRLMQRLGYKIPEVEPSDMGDLIVLLRVTPGIPFPVQNYLLGLAGVPFRKYFAVSCVLAWLNNAAFIVFGAALLKGQGRMIVIAISLIAALAAATHLVRRHYAGRARRLAAAKS